ncbi:uncharacterized protein EKO05_0001012 [Ascochyta rabiei]|uniref:Uncharacterized protein n=1 Tax=Didymella rabiei TaxID=5454 RepID=A0A163EQ36_DIDRA|nr:uncharacterized protein EKO05_0001012 [Ascochyta rabiei]KZM23837.1 hypothetical protein ST47_g5053 [Ascochyta rabiei]UPX10348.1 hypothetical protein EKO05_0001012 [Ascochyta rabiei]
MKISANFICAAFAAGLVPKTMGSALPLPKSIPWETTTHNILLSEIGPFNLTPQSGASNPSSGALDKRSGYSARVCKDISAQFTPQTGGVWHFREARCDRSGTDINTFRVECFGGRNWIEHLPQRKGQCGPREWCVDYHGRNAKGDQANDVFCVNRKDIHTWVANTQTRQEDVVTCSAGWTNDYKQTAYASLEVDVMDSAGINAIAPRSIFYKLNQKLIGISRGNDPFVGSGTIAMPPGSTIQACVTAYAAQSQILNILGAMVAFSLVKT